jgi:hypothetical protein
MLVFRASLLSASNMDMVVVVKSKCTSYNEPSEYHSKLEIGMLLMFLY